MSRFLSISSSKFNSLAIGSDTPRSFGQYCARLIARLIVRIFRINNGGFFATEFSQQIKPIVFIPTACGLIKTVGGHGRLRWRSRTFFSDDPKIVEWINAFSSDDIFLDVGSNVGLFSLYAAYEKKCRVISVEPEARNFAILIENIYLNQLEDQISPANLALTDTQGVESFFLSDITSGGAHHQLGSRSSALPERQRSPMQLIYGAPLDQLVEDNIFPIPNHIKIDVDGLEAKIIQGSIKTLADERCKSLMVEIEDHCDQISGVSFDSYLSKFGFRRVSSSRNTSTPIENQTATNVLFSKN